MRVRALPLVLLLTVAPSFSAAGTCAAYPAGIWKLDQPSALQFEHEWLRVLQQKDTAALDCMLTADFVDTSRKGVRRPKDVVLRQLSSHREQDQYQQTLAELEADLHGDTAVVHGVNVISDQQGHEVLRIRFTDVLYYRDGRWLAVSAQETDEQKP